MTRSGARVPGLRRSQQCRRGVDILDPALTSGLVDCNGDHAAADRAGMAEREDGGCIGLLDVVPEYDLAWMERLLFARRTGRVDDDDRTMRPWRPASRWSP